MKDDAHICKYLHKLLKGKENKTYMITNTKAVMTTKAVDAFIMLKEQLTKPSILGYVIHVDASVHGAVLY